MRWRRSPEVLWRAAPGYLVVATLDGHVIEADGPASEVWTRLDDWVDESVLVHDLATHFAVDEGDVSTTVKGLLRTLRTHGCVASR